MSTAMVTPMPAAGAPASEVVFVEAVNSPMPAVVPPAIGTAATIAFIRGRWIRRDRYPNPYGECA